MYVVGTVLLAWDERRRRKECPASELASLPVDPVAYEEQESLTQTENLRDGSERDSRHFQAGSVNDAELAPLLEPEGAESDSSSD